MSQVLDFRGELAAPFQGCLEAGAQGLGGGATLACAGLPGGLIAQTDDDGAEVGLGVEPGPRYAGGGRRGRKTATAGTTALNQAKAWKGFRDLEILQGYDSAHPGPIRRRPSGDIPANPADEIQTSR